MKLAIIIFVLFAFAFSASALDLATRDGRVFENARVVRVEPDGITVRHSAGLEKIPARLLSDEDRERYGLTPEAAREYAAKRREAVARRERDLQSAEALAVRDAELQKHAKNYLLFCIQCDEDGVLSRDRHNWHFIIHGFKATPGTWFNLYAAPLGIEPFGSFEHPCELVPLTPPPDRKPSHAPGLDKTGH